MAKNSNKKKIMTELITEAKRAYVYRYGTEQKMDGKITISKNCFKDTADIDFVVEIEEGNIVIENCSDHGMLFPTTSFQIDEYAIHALCDIFDEYDRTHTS